MAQSERLQIQIPKDIATSARVVAALEGKSIAALVHEILAPELARREQALLGARQQEIKQAPASEPPKRGRPKKGGPS